MRSIVFFFLILFATVFVNAHDKTIILVRHAEKDASSTVVRADPDLSPEGRQRAFRLFETVRNFNPQYVFSTNFRRTRFTVDPLATNQNEKYRMFVQTYNFSKLEAFAEQLLNLKTKCILVVGHSNTTPQLANLLLKQQKYKDLDESVYNKIFIIRVKGKKVTDEIIEY